MNQVQEMQSLCQQYMNQAVHTQMNGQPAYNGVIENVDNEYLYLLVPVDEFGQYMDLADLMGDDQQNQMVRSYQDQRYPYYAYNPYYQPYFYPYYPRPRGWNRLILPLAALTAIALL
ncbi:hypothetical protein PQ478_03795 [Alkalihalophilus pseudofirmus]|uniref:hypothetical protein n=1 Tax=Alkalihalophilus pseudofirmus TaxID=79885 RepID=UPI00259BAD26|nr:hypothetical protein [Alkalihalophilus pseudofirmus]WEG17624.1 hypothetical protein PQ478_03795 [Alkalihalophilus pseudofirmus]